MGARHKFGGRVFVVFFFEHTHSFPLTAGCSLKSSYLGHLSPAYSSPVRGLLGLQSLQEEDSWLNICFLSNQYCPFQGSCVGLEQHLCVLSWLTYP